MGSGLFEIILLAVFAAIVFRQLFTILGRKIGDEDQPRPVPRRSGEPAPARRPGAGPTVRPVEPPPLTAPHNREYFDTADEALLGALGEIQKVDRSFEPKAFLDGARIAYEMIVVAFAKGDKKTLRALLNKDVFKNFEQVIDERQERGETIETTFIGVKSARIIAAALKGRLVEVTVRFVGELISVTRNSDGAVIDGDPTTVFDVTDVWTFARDARSSDPNWQLVGTAAP